jgi:hypothetical protein
VKQAKSKQKILDKMVEAGLTQPVQKEHTFQFQFPGACAAPFSHPGCYTLGTSPVWGANDRLVGQKRSSDVAPDQESIIQAIIGQ